MPVMSMSHGILIRMYTLDTEHHHLPHLHARFAEFEASVGIGDGELLAGELPRRQMRLVQAWVELDEDELMADWLLASSGQKRFRIDSRSAGSLGVNTSGRSALYQTGSRPL